VEEKDERPGRAKKKGERKAKGDAWCGRKDQSISSFLGHLLATSLAPSFSHDTLHIQIQRHTPVLSTPSFLQPSLSL